MKRRSQKSFRLGLVVNTAIKPSRDVMLGVLDAVRNRQLYEPLFFHASAATSPGNLAKFASSGVDGIVVCGVRYEIAMDFLRLCPNHPPIVFCVHSPYLELDAELMENVGIVRLDNEAIGRQAADFFLSHGLQNFAFIACNIYREQIAGEIRCAAFERFLRSEMGEHMTFRRLSMGVVAENEDFWDTMSTSDDLKKMLTSLPKPCGILANSDRTAQKILSACCQLRLSIPEHIEVLGINNTHGICELTKPTLSSICPDQAQCAERAVEMLLTMIADPDLPTERRNVLVSGGELIERGSTGSGHDFGHVISRVREFVRANACSGISVLDVARHIRVSRRMLEKRVRAATGQSVLSMIQKVRLDNVCRLLTKTNLPISEVTMQSGYELTSNLGKLFRKTFGMSMRDYRAKHCESA